MHELRTEIEIDAPADVVWGVLTDFDAYPDWNPFVKKIRGEARTGERIEVTLEQPGNKPITFRPEVRTVEENRAFVWFGRLGLPRIFDGEHHLEIEPLEEGRVRFVHRESFAGVLIPFMKKMIATKTRDGFVAMNAALKGRAEARARA